MTDTIDKKEKIILEYLLSDREVYLKAHSILKPTFFKRPLDSVVKYTSQFFADYHKIPDFDVIEAETSIQLSYRECDDADREYVLDEVEQHCARAAMVEAILQSADMVHEENVNLSDIQGLVRDALTVKLDKTLGTELFADPRTRIERAELAVDAKPLGIPKFDELADNWRRKELNFIVAGTSVGKSVTLANVADCFARQGEDVLIYSVEMNEELYSKRLDSIVTGVPINEPNIDDIVAELEARQESYGRIIVKKISPRFSVEDMRAHLLEYHMTYGKYPDVCVLDYIDIFANAANTSGMSKYDWDELKTHTVRDIMDEFNMRGFTASQLNRDGYGLADIGPQHVQGGLSKIQGADGAFAFVATEEDLENNCFQVKGIKLRNSNKKHVTITLYRCPKTLRLTDEPVIAHQKPNPVIDRKKQKQDTSDQEKPSSKRDALKSATAGRSKLKDAIKLSQTT